MQSPLSAATGRDLIFVLLLSAGCVLVLLAGLAAIGHFGLLSTRDAARFDLAFGFVAYSVLLAAIWYAAIRAPKRSWRDIGLRASGQAVLVLAGLAAFLWAGVSAGIYAAADMWDIALSAGRNLVDPFRGNAINLAALAVLAGPVAAFVEEILFRGLLYGWLRRRMGIVLAAVGSAIIFTACHVYVFVAGLPFVVEMMLLSVLLGLLFEFTRSLWPGIVLHATNNLIVVVLYLQLG